MKNTLYIITTLLLLSSSLSAATEKEIVSEIRSVTLYFQGADITRSAEVSLEKGEYILRFTNLSPYIRKESIRVTGEKNATILNVNYQLNYLSELKRKEEIEGIKKELEKNGLLIEDENTRMSILKEKETFLKNNMVISGKNEAVSPDDLKMISDFYGKSMESLAMDMLKSRRNIAELQKQQTSLTNQLILLQATNTVPSGEILVSVSVAQAAKVPFVLNYLVDNASWYPSYDIRVERTGEPMQVSFKANISQNTGVDWKNVELTLTNAQTGVSGNLIELSPWYLRYFNPYVMSTGNTLMKAEAEADEEMLYEAPAPSIAIRGVSSLSKEAAPMYIVDGVPVDDISSINPDDIASIDVLKDASATSIYGSRATNGAVVVSTKKKKGSSGPLTVVSRGTTFTEFQIAARQTLTSGNEEQVIRFREAEIPASYEYKAIPKTSAHVYLVGRINNWFDANLMNGEVNLYLEKTFAGKSYLSTDQFNDTISLSFGVDNGISVSREKVLDFTAPQVIGTNVKVTRTWKIKLQNNKPYAVELNLNDQIPLSTMKEIEVKALELSGGTLEAETGKVSWKIPLAPGATKEILLSFEVKYPKDKTLDLE